MEEQRRKILKMLSEGKIDEQQAEDLLDAVCKEEKKAESINVGYDKAAFEEDYKAFRAEAVKEGKEYLLVYVSSADGDNVKVKLPISFVKIMVGAVKNKENIYFNNVVIDTATLKKAIDSGIVGRIIEVESDNADKVIVEII